MADSERGDAIVDVEQHVSGEGAAEQPILVTRSSMPPLQEYVAEIAPLWESHWLTNMGRKHREFSQMLEQRLEVENVCLFTNGHNALECILEALEVEGEVITTPFTFASTTHRYPPRRLHHRSRQRGGSYHAADLRHPARARLRRALRPGRARRYRPPS